MNVFPTRLPDIALIAPRVFPEPRGFFMETWQAERYRKVPPGFAHGFCVLSETTNVLYKGTDFYTPGDEYGLRWDEPSLDIAWPVSRPVLSANDSQDPTLHTVARAHLPVVEALP